jgi:L-asparagine transporter-like permease
MQKDIHGRTRMTLSELDREVRNAKAYPYLAAAAQLLFVVLVLVSLYYNRKSEKGLIVMIPIVVINLISGASLWRLLRARARRMEQTAKEIKNNHR